MEQLFCSLKDLKIGSVWDPSDDRTSVSSCGVKFIRAYFLRDLGMRLWHRVVHLLLSRRQNFLLSDINVLWYLSGSASVNYN